MPPYSPDPRPGTMSYSFQTPVYTDSPGSRLGKSYFGDPSPLERDFSLSRGNESFVPTDRARNSIGYQDSSFSDRVGTPLNTNRFVLLFVVCCLLFVYLLFPGFQSSLLPQRRLELSTHNKQTQKQV